MKKYELWIDHAKAMGIIFVVIGHSGNENIDNYIYWFHMPLFFIISGYTFNSPNTKKELMESIRKKFFSFLLPYVSFGVTILFTWYIYGGIWAFSINEVIKKALYLFYGGQKLTGEFGVFWFVTCLFITQLFFSILNLYIKSDKKVIFIIFLFYMLSHIYSYGYPYIAIPAPWGIDIAFLTITYFAIGYYFKKNISLINNNKYALTKGTIISFIVIVIFESLFDLNYSLDLKYVKYEYLFLDFYIPITFSFLIIVISIWFSKVDILTIFSLIGKNSMVIMYLHLPIKMILSTDNWLVISFLGIALPLLVNTLFIKNKIYRKYYLGTNRI